MNLAFLNYINSRKQLICYSACFLFLFSANAYAAVPVITLRNEAQSPGSGRALTWSVTEGECAYSGNWSSGGYLDSSQGWRWIPVGGYASPFNTCVHSSPQGTWGVGCLTIVPGPGPTTKTYTVTCRNAWGSDSKSTTVNASIQPLTASCGSAPNPANINQFVAWTATVGGGTSPYTYAWTGDDQLSSSSAVVNKTYTTLGTKNATLQVRSNDGQVQTAMCSVNVQPVLRIIDFTPTPASGQVPLSNISFNITIDGTATGIARYRFDCTNDGTWERTRSVNQNTLTENVVCNYLAVGTYTAKVEVTRAGTTVERTTTITATQAQALFRDIGFKIRQGGVEKRVAIENGTMNSKLRVRKAGVEYAVALVNPGDSKALKTRVRIGGQLKALREFESDCRVGNVGCPDICDDATTRRYNRGTCNQATGECSLAGQTQSCFSCTNGACSQCGNGTCETASPWNENTTSCPADCSCQAMVSTSGTCGTSCSGVPQCTATQACQTTSYNFPAPACPATQSACVSDGICGSTSPPQSCTGLPTGAGYQWVGGGIPTYTQTCLGSNGTTCTSWSPAPIAQYQTAGSTNPCQYFLNLSCPKIATCNNESILIGNTIWSACNAGASNDTAVGGNYTYGTMASACPTGWHPATSSDWGPIQSSCVRFQGCNDANCLKLHLIEGVKYIQAGNPNNPYFGFNPNFAFMCSTSTQVTQWATSTGVRCVYDQPYDTATMRCN